MSPKGFREESARYKDANNAAGEREHYLRSLGIKDGPAGKFLFSVLRNARQGRWSPEGGKVDTGLFRNSWLFEAACVGGRMEQVEQIIRGVNSEIVESKKILETLQNEVIALTDVIQPQLLALAKDLRASRMTVVSEIQLSLTAMREVRKFFLESDYATEVERLERFLRLCREFQALKAEGVLDAVTDSAIRLALKEELK